MPLFAEELSSHIFNCGKTLNLLRVCNPYHFLFGIYIGIPRVMLTFSEQELRNLETSCQVYAGQMGQIARQFTVSRTQKRLREERAKTMLMVRARRVATRELHRLQERQAELHRAVDAKKRKEFSELKEQMEKDLSRRAAERANEKESDAVRAAAATRQELLEAHVEEETEVKARSANLNQKLINCCF